MKLDRDRFQLSATDLSSHPACRHLTALDRRRARGEIAPPAWFDPGWEALRERGLAHERAYIEHLSGQGLEVRSLHDGSDVERTREAMREGVAVISQAPLVSSDGRWTGWADVLLRVETSSQLGGWSYEVQDTKLARETRAGTLLQLCLYSELVAEIQGTWPERMHVVSPGRGIRAGVLSNSRFRRLLPERQTAARALRRRRGDLPGARAPLRHLSLVAPVR